MTVLEIKQNIYNIIEEIQNKSILEELHLALLEAQKADANNDFWDELSFQQQKSIEKSLQEVKEGKTIPHSEVQKKYHQWLMR
ncbi:MAG: hypothetical protein R3E32_03180 [Chitinophagales bacterium]